MEDNEENELINQKYHVVAVILFPDRNEIAKVCS